MTQHIFNPSEHLMQIKSSQGSKDYLPVQWRLVWFREQCPQGTIVTEMVHLDMDKECEEEVSVWNAEKRRSEKVIRTGRGIAIFRATVTDGKGGSATGTKSEKACSFPDFIEKAETGAIGRALAGLEYGTQFVGDELDEAHRIVDAPADVRTSATNSTGNGRIVAMRSTHGENHADPEAVTDQQLASIRKLCEHLGKAEPENAETMSYATAKDLIAQLSLEYRQSRSKAGASR
jgi:hypothetical protein